jgi:hypothetical protein
MSVSPFDTLDVDAVKLMTSADSRFSATSNDVRVRVDASKNKFTTVRPRSVGTLRIRRPPTSFIERAVSRMRSICARFRSSMPRRCFIAQRLPCP